MQPSDPPLTWPELLLFIACWWGVLFVFFLLVLGWALARNAGRISREEESQMSPCDSGEL